MKDPFAVRLSKLRKERRISQKEAAAFFGISQALLSHYENGVRKCGIDFVLKAAELYGVSTDYLLGRSTAKHNIGSSFEEDENDRKLCGLTLYRAVTAIYGQFAESASSELIMQCCLYLYKVLLQGISEGTVPSNWLNLSTSSQLFELKKLINAINIDLSNQSDEKINLTKSETPAPICVQTAVSEAQKVFSGFAKQMLDNLPI